MAQILFLDPPPLVETSEAESFLPVPERRVKTPRIEAQSTAIAQAMARICNDEPGCFGVQGGHRQKTLSLSAPRRCCERCGADVWTISAQGWVACADCELIHPMRVQALLERPTFPETSTLP